MDSVLLKACTGCKVEQPRENYHKDKLRADGLNIYCKGCRKARLRAKYEGDPETERARARAWQSQNREKVAARVKRWRRANPEKEAAMHKAWVQANPENVSVRNQRRRAHKLAAEGSHTVKEWKAKLAQYKGRCHWCGKKIKGVTHADHVIPLSRSGTNYISNIVPSCAFCNLSKHSKLPHEFMGRLL